MREKPAPTRPRFVELMPALGVGRLPEGPEWLYEIKLDGYRAYVLKEDDHVEARTALIDGEIVAVDSQDIPRFQMLQHRSATPRSSVTFYGFDLLYLTAET